MMLGVATAAFLLNVLARGKVRVPSPGIAAVGWGLAAWVGYSLGSVAWAISPQAAIIDCVLLLMGVLTIILTIHFASNRIELRTLHWLWVVNLVGLVLVGLWEHITGRHLPMSRHYGETRTNFMYMPTGPFFNPNDYATVLTLALPFVLTFLRYTTRTSMRLLSLALAGTTVYLVLVTGSSANLAAIVLMVGLQAWTSFEKSGRRRRNFIGVSLVGASLLAVAATIWLVQPTLSSEGWPALLGGTSAESLRVRLNLARNVGFLLMETFGFGVGAGNVEHWMQHFARYDTHGVLNVHNWWLELFANYGIGVGLAYIVGHGWLVKEMWTFRRRASGVQMRQLYEALLLALVGFTASSLSPSSLMSKTPLWLLLATALAAANWSKGMLQQGSVTDDGGQAAPPEVH